MQKNCWNYPVELVEDVFGESSVLADTLKKIAGTDAPRVLLVADQNVVQRTEGLGTKIGAYVQRHGISLAASPVVISGGEKIKADNLQSALRVVSALLGAKLGKGDFVLALGGGTLLDVVGYAAAQVRGGIGIVRIPTTPAAMMDAAFADYAAVDSVSVKDALRVGSVPSAVVVDPLFAKTVLDGVWRGGVCEAIRLGAAVDAPLFKRVVGAAGAYRAHDFGTLTEIVEAVVAVRRKKGGTTFADWAAARLEAMSGYKLPHGYSIAIGICIDAMYAVLKGILKERDRTAIIEILKVCGAIDGLAHSMHLLTQGDSILYGLDAWRLATGSAGIVLPTAIGKSMVEEEPDREAFLAAIKACISMASGN